MTPLEWAKCCMALRSAFPTSFKLDEDGMNFWFECLADLPGEQVLGAIVHMAKTTPAFPSIAGIREIAEIRPGADTAWEEVIRNLNRYEVPAWSDPKISQAVKQLGGFIALCNADDKNMPTLRSQFLKAFSSLCQKEEIRETYQALGIDREKPVAMLTEGRREVTDGTGV